MTFFVVILAKIIFYIFGTYNWLHYQYVTWHEKIGLICAHKISPHFLTLKFHNFVSKYSSTMELLQLVQYIMGNVMQLPNFIASQKVR